MPSFEGNLLTQRHEMCSQETRDSTLSYGENRESPSHLSLIRYRDVSPGRTDTSSEEIILSSAVEIDENTCGSYVALL